MQDKWHKLYRVKSFSILFQVILFIALVLVIVTFINSSWQKITNHKVTSGSRQKMIWVLGKGMEMRSWGSFVPPCKSPIITPVPKPKIRINTQDQCVMRLCVFINYQIGTYTLSIYLNLFVIYLLLTKKKHIYKSKFL